MRRAAELPPPPTSALTRQRSFERRGRAGTAPSALASARSAPLFRHGKCPGRAGGDASAVIGPGAAMTALRLRVLRPLRPARTRLRATSRSIPLALRQGSGGNVPRARSPIAAPARPRPLMARAAQSRSAAGPSFQRRASFRSTPLCPREVTIRYDQSRTTAHWIQLIGLVRTETQRRIAWYSFSLDSRFASQPDFVVRHPE